MTFKSFTEISAWQKARELSQRIYLLSGSGSFAMDVGLKDQINRATGSIMDNVDRESKNEFVNFLTYSKGSSGETLSQLYRALDRGHISKEEFEQLNLSVDGIRRMLGGFIIYFNKSNIRGLKFKDRI
jgi:four helix bundle protein